jgi:nucleotide-binding universal stress UspA family protein
MYLRDTLGGPAVLLHVDAQAHVFSDSFHAVDEEDLRRMKAAYRGQSIAAMRRLVESQGRSAEGIELAVREGRPHEVVVAEGRERGAQLLVLGSRVRHGVERLLLGRTAVRAARHASCGVFTVNVHRPWQGVTRVLCASDLREGGRAAERWAARLAGTFGAQLTVLHVSELGSELAAPYVVPPHAKEGIKSTLEERLEGLKLDLAAEASAFPPGPAGVRARLFFAHDPAAAIVEVARDEKADVVVVGTHGRHGLARALLGSVAEGVLTHADVAVLTARDAEG